jgi:hypothetical protein
MDLPDKALQHVLTALPLDQLAGPCSLVCRQLQAAATIAASTLMRLECSSSSRQAAAAIEQYLRTHGSRLEALKLEGPKPCSLPVKHLHQLQALKLINLQLFTTFDTRREGRSGGYFMNGAGFSAAAAAGAAAAAAGAAAAAAGAAAAAAKTAAAKAPAIAALHELTALTNLQLDSCHILNHEHGMIWLASELLHLPRLRQLQVQGLHSMFGFDAACGGKEINGALEQLTLLTSFTLTRRRGGMGGTFTALSRLSQLQHLKLGLVGSDFDPLSLTSLPSSLTALELQECIVSRLPESSSWLQLPQLQQLRIAEVRPSKVEAHMRLLGIVPDSPAVLTAAARKSYAALLSPRLHSLSFALHSKVPPAAAAGLMDRLLQLQQLTSLTTDLESPSENARLYIIPVPAFSSFSNLQQLYLAGVGSDSHPVDLSSLPGGLTALGMWDCTLKGPDTTFSSKLCSALSSVSLSFEGLGNSSSSTGCTPVLQNLLLSAPRCSTGPWAGSAWLGTFLAQQPHVTCLA